MREGAHRTYRSQRRRFESKSLESTVTATTRPPLRAGGDFVVAGDGPPPLCRHGRLQCDSPMACQPQRGRAKESLLADRASPTSLGRGAELPPLPRLRRMGRRAGCPTQNIQLRTKGRGAIRTPTFIPASAARSRRFPPPFGIRWLLHHNQNPRSIPVFQCPLHTQRCT